jgi:hypothetical protein
MSKKNLIWAAIIIIAIILSFVLFPNKSEAPAANDPDNPTGTVTKPAVRPSTSKTTTTPSGEYLLTGYYERYTKNIEDQGYAQSYTCDGFVILKAGDKQTQTMLDLIRGVSTANTVTPDGKMRVNLNFVDTAPATIDKITASTEKNQITLRMTDVKEPKPTGPCANIFKIAGIK